MGSGTEMAMWARRRPKRASIARGAVLGVAAGAAGTCALDVATYGDMLVRGRSQSELPSKIAKRLTTRLHIPLGEGEQKGHAARRREAIGALLGYGTGVAVGAACGIVAARWPRVPTPALALVTGATAMVVADAPAVIAGLTSPRRWGTDAWLADLVPHACYGAVTAMLARHLATEATRGR
jgi:hypothetical protein